MAVMKNMSLCDLRGINTVEAANKITEIKKVALLLLPKDAPDDVLGALQAIKKTNVSSILMVEKDAVVRTVNGFSEISGADCNPDSENILLINGECVMHSMPADCKTQLIVNGRVIEHESLREHSGIRLNVINGSRIFAEFDSVCKISGDFEITATDCKPNSTPLFIVSGSCVVHPLPEDRKCRFLMHQDLIMHESLRGHDGVQIIEANGNQLYVDFNQTKQLHGKILIDAAFLQKLSPKTLLLVRKGWKNRLTFAKDVTPELLEEKQPIIKCDKVFCPKALRSPLAVLCICCAPKIKRW